LEEAAKIFPPHNEMIRNGMKPLLILEIILILHPHPIVRFSIKKMPLLDAKAGKNHFPRYYSAQNKNNSPIP